VRFERERLELADGDFLDLDWVKDADGIPARGDGPLVVVLHGLEGCAQSGYALEMYRALFRVGLDAVGMNFRSCSGEANRLPRMYHSGDTGDLTHVLDLLAGRLGSRPTGAVGFSLGGNVLLKYLGEQKKNTPIRAAAAISVPFDLGAGADHLERGFGKVYRYYLVRRLMRKVRAKVHLLDGVLNLERASAARTFREFDDAVTAVLHGFEDADDYYRRSSSRQFVPRVSIPTLIVHAEDDPFLPPGTIRQDPVQANPHLTLRITPRGGHVGFVSGSPRSPVFWAEREAGRFLAARLRPTAP
jgi:predicted alpha/beta-fold hydrolase